MLANYGYGKGRLRHLLHPINTACCAACEEKRCLTVCPAHLFTAELDDFDDEVVTIPERSAIRWPHHARRVRRRRAVLHDGYPARPFPIPGNAIRLKIYLTWRTR